MTTKKTKRLVKIILTYTITMVLIYLFINIQTGYKKAGILIEKNENTTLVGIEINNKLDITELYSLANKIYKKDTKKNIYETDKVKIYFTDDKKYASFDENDYLTVEKSEKRFELGYVEFDKLNNNTSQQIEMHLNKIDWTLEPTIDEYQRYNDFKTYIINKKGLFIKTENELEYKKNYEEFAIRDTDFEELEIKFKMNETEIKDLISKVESWRNINN